MSGKQSQYDIGLDKTPANYVALTPLSFIARSAAVYPDHVSTVYEGRAFTWAETYARCRRFASYLARQGIGEGACDERTALCGPDGGRGVERAQHPPRCPLDCLPARPWRRQDHSGRSGI